MSGYADYTENLNDNVRYGSITDDSFHYGGTEFTIAYVTYNALTEIVFMELDRCLPPSDLVKLELDRSGGSDWEDSSPSGTTYSDANCAEDPFERQVFSYRDVHSNPLPAGAQVTITITFR